MAGLQDDVCFLRSPLLIITVVDGGGAEIVPPRLSAILINSVILEQSHNDVSSAHQPRGHWGAAPPVQASKLDENSSAVSILMKQVHYPTADPRAGPSYHSFEVSRNAVYDKVNFACNNCPFLWTMLKIDGKKLGIFISSRVDWISSDFQNVLPKKTGLSGS